jgi:hypothetical protein
VLDSRPARVLSCDRDWPRSVAQPHPATDHHPGAFHHDLINPLASGVNDRVFGSRVANSSPNASSALLAGDRGLVRVERRGGIFKTTTSVWEVGATTPKLARTIQHWRRPPQGHLGAWVGSHAPLLDLLFTGKRTKRVPLYRLGHESRGALPSSQPAIQTNSTSTHESRLECSSKRGESEEQLPIGRQQIRDPISPSADEVTIPTPAVTGPLALRPTASLRARNRQCRFPYLGVSYWRWAERRPAR